MRQLQADPRFVLIRLDQCMVNLRDTRWPFDLFQKGTGLLVPRNTALENVGMRCDGAHNHAWIIGGKRSTAAGVCGPWSSRRPSSPTVLRRQPRPQWRRAQLCCHLRHLEKPFFLPSSQLCQVGCISGLMLYVFIQALELVEIIVSWLGRSSWSSTAEVLWLDLVMSSWIDCQTVWRQRQVSS